MGRALALSRIVAGVLEDVAAREARVPFLEIKARSSDMPAPRDPLPVLSSRGCSVIVEIKRVLRKQRAAVEIDSVADLARQLAEEGVHILACQTEKLRFQGSLEDMAAARSAVDLPMMCRDIIMDPYQIHEARCYGADMIPLQVELLDQARFVSLVDRIESLGMTAVAEVRTPGDADRAIEAGVQVIGINAWSLASDNCDTSMFSEIAPGLPSDMHRLALGGVRSPQDLLAYAGCGADAVVVGESVMSAEDPARVARSLVITGSHPSCPSRR